jgi:hypothetical protein
MSQIVDLKREVKTRQRTGLGVTGALVLVVVLGALALSTRWFGSDEAGPPAGLSKIAAARQVASGFFTAYDAYDADRMLTYLDSHAVAMQWASAESLRGDAAWREAAGWTELREPCRASKGGQGTVDLRCDYRVHALGSEQLGRGPFGGGYWSLHVRDGQIVYAFVDFPYNSNGFSGEVWEPFLAFVEANHRGDADSMYTGDRSDPLYTPEALRLWKQRVADYVAAETPG